MSEPPASPCSDPTKSVVGPEELQKRCDEEFARYHKERDTIIKNELEAEKNFDTTLLSLSTLAIGASLTIYKDIVRAGSATPLIVISWLFLGICIFASLTDRLLSYFTHKQWRDILDGEFTHYVERGGVGAWDRVLPKYEEIPWVKHLPKLKWVSFGTLALGIVFLMLFVLIAEPPKATPVVAPLVTVAPTPVSVVVYAATTQPTVSTSPTTQQTFMPLPVATQPTTMPARPTAP